MTTRSDDRFDPASFAADEPVEFRLEPGEPADPDI
jgi:hypothetical protein